MIVYVVQAYADRYEFGGYDEPLVAGAFSTPGAAEECAANFRRTSKGGYRTHARVDALVLDHPEQEVQ